VTEHGAADRAGHEAHAEARECEERADERAGLGEEDLREDERGRRAVMKKS
jgi:hypothetical protein